MVFLWKIILVALATTNAKALKSFEEEWQEFLEDFKPKYINSEDQEYRKTIFLANLEKIRKHNEEYKAGLHTYSQKVNHFSDKTERELVEDDNVFLDSSEERREDIRNRSSIFELANDPPDDYDWRQFNAVTQVKDQGECHSSWAFTAIGSIEGQYFLDRNVTTNFSAQQILDCSYSNRGCRGGNMARAFSDLKDLGGVATENDYPYKAKTHHCKFSKKMTVAKVDGYTRIEKGDEEALKQGVVGYGPIAALVSNTGRFHHYHEGIFYDDACKSNQDLKYHAVLIIGYGSEEGKDYWLVKNSWGTDWGQGGFGKIARNMDNHCDIAGHAVVPYLKQK